MAKDPTRVFIHGLESSSRGNKGRFFSERFPDMIVEDFPGSFEQRMDRLERLLEGRAPLILVGSSYGGLMAAVYACRHEERVDRLVLLAPALHLEPLEPYRERTLGMPVTIFHGRSDDVVPLDAIRPIARRLFADLQLHVVDDDHPLSATFATYDWDALLGTSPF
jgi:pimeloyl-ACP methyl ester carboxylesterase